MTVYWAVFDFYKKKFYATISLAFLEMRDQKIDEKHRIEQKICPIPLLW